MNSDYKFLDDSEWDKAHRVIRAWKNDRGGAHTCPRCDAAGVQVVDNSVRPYSEWYEVTCEPCRLRVTLHLPLAPTPGASF